MVILKQAQRKSVDIRIIGTALALIGLLMGWSEPAWSAAEVEAADSAEKELGVAPIRLKLYKFGSLDFLLRSDILDKNYVNTRVTKLRVGVGTTIESFIWQPWIARVGTTVTGTVGRDVTDIGKNSLGLHSGGQVTYKTVTGGARLSLLPRSRFPLNISADRSDYRSDAGSTASQQYGLITNHFDIRQTYLSRFQNTSYSGSYTRNRTEDTVATVENRETQDFDLAHAFYGSQIFRFTGNKQTIKLDPGRTVAKNQALFASHSYRPGSEISIGTFANRSRTTFGGSAGELGIETLQLNSAGSWRPSTRFVMAGGLRLFDSYSLNNGLKSTTTSYTGANLGANYQFAKWLRLYGSVDIMDQSGTQTVSPLGVSNMNLSLAASHRPRGISFGSFDYSRHVAANISNIASSKSTNNATISSTTQVASLMLDHTLRSNRPVLGAGQLIFTQSASTRSSRSSSSGGSSKPAVQLNQSGSVVWRRASGMLRIKAYDKRSMYGKERFATGVNLQASQTERIGQGAETLFGDLTIDASQIGFNADPRPTTDRLTSTASLSYKNPRTFNIRNMIFTSILQLISKDLLQADEFSGRTRNEGKYSWKNRLTYQIGKTNVDAIADIAEVQARRRATLLFQVRRNF